jgi:hypothetical protein
MSGAYGSGIAKILNECSYCWHSGCNNSIRECALQQQDDDPQFGEPNSATLVSIRGCCLAVCYFLGGGLRAWGHHKGDSLQAQEFRHCGAAN